MRQHTFCIEVNEGQRSHAKRNVQTQVKSAVFQVMELPCPCAKLWNCLAHVPSYGIASPMCQAMELPCPCAKLWNCLLHVPSYGIASPMCQAMELPCHVPSYGIASSYGTALPMCQVMELPPPCAKLWNCLAHGHE